MNGDTYDSWFENGFQVLRGVIDASCIDGARREIDTLIRHHWNSVHNDEFPGVDRAAYILMNRSAPYRKLLYRRLNNCLVAPYRLFELPFVQNVVQALGIARPCIHSAHLRIALPNEPHMSTEWHQDTGVMNTDRAVCFWVPLHEIAESDGSLKVMPGSHKLEVIAPEGINFRGHSFLPKEVLDRYQPIADNYNAGDALIFHPNLLHDVSENLGSKFRCVLLLRVEDISDVRFVDLEKNPLHKGYIMRRDNTSKSGFSEVDMSIDDLKDIEEKRKYQLYKAN